MKIALYIENQNIAGVDLRRPERGNPGIGGTEFNFLSLTSNMIRRFPEDEYCIFANSTGLFPDYIRVEKAQDCVDAVQLAIEQGFDFFIWRPTVRTDAERLIENINDYPIKFIIWAHNTPPKAYLDVFSSSINVRRFVPVGFEQARLIKHTQIEEKLTTIHNGFEIQTYLASRAPSKDNNLVVYTGSLIPVKGFGMLARAWPEVLKKCPQAKLKVMGSGTLYNRNSELGRWGIADRKFEEEEIIPYLSDDNGQPVKSVEFLGVVGAEKVDTLKTALIGVVNPSGRGENCPGSAIEFLASGTAVVSANCQGILDVVEHDRTGLLGEGVEDLVANICSLLQNPERAIELGGRGPDVIRDKFNYDLICSQWRRIFLEETPQSAS